MLKEIYLQGKGQKWSLGNDFENYKNFFSLYGFKISKNFIPFNKIVYLSNKYTAYKTNLHYLKNDLVFDYFHGHPEINPEFKVLFDNIKKNIRKFTRIRISNSIIEKLFTDHGLKDKIFKIYLGVDTNKFKFDRKIRNFLREKNKIPSDSIVIGSFQKDSNGWSGSKSPKLIKGPDIFVNSIKKIYKSFQKIFVVLCGPEREFVKNELKKLNVPFVHFYENNYYDIVKYYSVLDFYFITAREEGGPKALLEAMACGIPVLSTPVGQANDLINNKNSFKTNSFDPNEISEIFLEKIKLSNLNDIKSMAEKTAKNHDFINQKNIWRDFFNFK